MDLRWGRSQPGNILHLAPSWEELRRRLRRHVKDSIRHCYNSLRTDGLTAHLDVAVPQNQIASALETFFDLHRTITRHVADVTRPAPFPAPIARRFLLPARSPIPSLTLPPVFTPPPP